MLPNDAYDEVYSKDLTAIKECSVEYSKTKSQATIHKINNSAVKFKEING